MTTRSPRSESKPHLTELLAHVRAGRREALDRVLPLVYQQLRRIARRQLAARPNDTLSPTGLVHELYLKIVRVKHPDWRDGAHFLAAAAVTMRNILVDRARRRLAEKRGGALCIVSLDEHSSVAVESEPDILLELNVALDRLAALEPRLARVIECRFFDGMSDQEIAAAVGVTDRTVRRDLAKARGLLFHMLRPPSSGDGGGSSVDDAA